MLRKKRLPAIETSIVVTGLLFMTWSLTVRYYADELEVGRYFASDGLEDLGHLQKRLGQNRYSRYAEELMIRDFFQDRRDGVFLDVGANHYRNDSNTYYLERELGWSGIAIDAIKEFGPDYSIHRPRTKFVAMFASDVADSSVKFFIPDDEAKLIASSIREFSERGRPAEEREVPTTTLNAVLEQAGVTHVDFMSMDIELSEPKALAGFDIDRYQPALVCIEAHPPVRQQIIDYFADHQYIMVGRYLRMDPTNLYFTPRKSN